MVQSASTDIAGRTVAIVDAMKGLEGHLLPILHGLQAEFGFVPRESLPLVAEALNISNAEVHGVVTFYHDYREHAAGRHVLKVCQAEACQSMGSDRVAARLAELLGIGFHETTRDGAVTMEPVYCLGLCSCAPAVMLDGEPIGRVDDEAMAEILAAVRS